MQFELIDMIIALALAAIVVFTPLLDPPLSDKSETRREKRQRHKSERNEFKAELKKEIVYRLSKDLESTSKALNAIEGELDDIDNEEGADPIRQETVKKLLERISEGIQALIKNAENDPNDIPSTKAFFRKYLEPTCKLAHSYSSFSTLKRKNAEVEKGMVNIEGMMRDVADAFEVKLVDLHQNDVLDIQSDISVMRTLLARDGLMEDENGNLTLRAEQ